MDVHVLLSKLSGYRTARGAEWRDVQDLLNDPALREREIRMVFAPLAMCVHELHGGSYRP